MNAKQAIHESIIRNRIVTIDYDREAADYLAGECDNSVKNSPVTEYWGTDADGDDWRVHMATVA